MTLIAALEIDQTLVLISDCAKSGKTNDEFCMPFFNEKGSFNYQNGEGRKIWGYEQKSYIINDDFCLAFSGDFVFGKALIKEIYSADSEGKIDLKDIFSFLNNSEAVKDYKQYMSVDLVGMIRGDQNLYRFQWSSDILQQQNHDYNDYIMGNGWKHFKEVILEDATQPHSDKQTSLEEKILFLLGHLYMHDFKDNNMASNNYGGLFEVILWRKDRFIKWCDYNFVLFFAHELDGKITMGPARIFLKPFYYKNLFCLCRMFYNSEFYKHEADSERALFTAKSINSPAEVNDFFPDKDILNSSFQISCVANASNYILSNYISSVSIPPLLSVNDDLNLFADPEDLEALKKAYIESINNLI